MPMPHESMAPAAPVPRHELRFVSLAHPGRCVAVPCDAAGHVDLDTLTERMRQAYLAVRAMVGRDYLHPTVSQLH